MKIFKFYILTLGLLLTLNSNAQKSPESLKAADKSKFSVHAGVGVAAYHGDLMQSDANMFKQANYSFSAAAAYAFTKKDKYKIRYWHT